MALYASNWLESVAESKQNYDAANMPIDKVPASSYHFASTNYNFMQNLWDLCAYACRSFFFFLYFASFTFPFVVCTRISTMVARTHTYPTTDLCFGLMDNPLVVPQWIIGMSRCGFFVCWSLLLHFFDLWSMFGMCWRLFHCLAIVNIIIRMQKTCWILI